MISPPAVIDPRSFVDRRLTSALRSSWHKKPSERRVGREETGSLRGKEERQKQQKKKDKSNKQQFLVQKTVLTSRI